MLSASLGLFFLAKSSTSKFTKALWRAKKPSGQAALLALAGYAFIRVFVDGFRADDVSLVLGLRATQLLFLALGIGALWVWAERRAKTQGGASL
ncbi:MAG TPA: prolipoprotein diacylglyceryl transferase [Thermoflexales bacterium]|nr:prolipoprotein diacylglyceryl transferase [Thermoflexales bacterium]